MHGWVTYRRSKLLPYSSRQMFLHVIRKQRYDIQIGNTVRVNQAGEAVRDPVHSTGRSN